MNHLDSSSNPSSHYILRPSSPAPFPASSNPSSATRPNPSPGQRDGRFNFPGTTPWGFLEPEGWGCMSLLCPSSWLTQGQTVSTAKSSS